MAKVEVSSARWWRIHKKNIDNALLGYAAFTPSATFECIPGQVSPHIEYEEPESETHPGTAEVGGFALYIK